MKKQPYILDEEALYAVIMKQLDKGVHPTKVSLYKWNNTILAEEDGYILSVGPGTCPYCITNNDGCNNCAFKTHGAQHDSCMSEGNPFSSHLRGIDRVAWAKSVYDYIYDIALAQAKESVLDAYVDEVVNIEEFEGMLTETITKWLAYYGVSNHKFSFDDIIFENFSIHDLVDHAFLRRSR